MLTKEQRNRNLSVPTTCVDVVLDTDAYNEIDDQYAIAYLLRSKEKLNTKAIYAAPFFNSRSEGPADGMEKSYEEIFKILTLLGEERPVLRGSKTYLADEQTPVVSPAALDLAERALAYSPEHPLYVVAIGAITNVASAILLEPKVAENTVVVWLGGHARHYFDTNEFNMKQDIAAARVMMKSGVPVVQLPCMGVVDKFALSAPELATWFEGKNELCDYLAQVTKQHAKDHKYQGGCYWSKVIWDVTAVAWLVNERFMLSSVQPVRLPDFNYQYEQKEQEHQMVYVYSINRNLLMEDMVKKLAGQSGETV